MPRVIGIDPGTVSVDVCGIDDGKVFLDRSLPTKDALADPATIVGLLHDAHRDAPIDLVAGPSGYGLPLTSVRDLTENDLRLAYLIAEGDSGGIGGLRTLMRALKASPFPIVLTPGVIHLATVPAHRKVNRVDMGTADKVCAVALAVHEEAQRRGCPPRDVSLILLELGGAFTAAIAVERGQIIDGLGGTSGPIGARAAGALDGEVAYLAGSISKELLFHGGVETIGGRLAREAYIESAVKAVAAIGVSAPLASEVVVSGRLGAVDDLRETLTGRLRAFRPGLSVRPMGGFADVAKAAAQGAALVADGLAGGRCAPLVEALGIREARGTVLDHLHVIDPAAARARLGIT